jgi:hypothetical protein
MAFPIPVLRGCSDIFLLKGFKRAVIGGGSRVQVTSVLPIPVLE